MAQKSKIEWTERTWNPIRGCSKISAGCEHCYAMHVAARFSGGGRPYDGLAKRDPVNWTGDVRLIEDALYEPLRRRKPTMYFVNSMSDLFHEKVPDDWIDTIFAVMAMAPRHTFQILTKRAQRMEEFFLDREAGQDMRRIGASRREIVQMRCLEMVEDDLLGGQAADVYMDIMTEGGLNWPLGNVWLGVSVENQEAAEERLDCLARTPAAVRFASVEPLLESADLVRWLHPSCEGAEDECERGECTCQTRPAIDWVIVGGESAQRGECRQCDVAWIRDIVAQCRIMGVPVFVKQLGSNAVSNVRSDHLGRLKYGDSMGAAEEFGEPWRLWLEDSKGGEPSEWPEGLRIRQFPASAGVLA